MRFCIFSTELNAAEQLAEQSVDELSVWWPGEDHRREILDAIRPESGAPNRSQLFAGLEQRAFNLDERIHEFRPAPQLERRVQLLPAAPAQPHHRLLSSAVADDTQRS